MAAQTVVYIVTKLELGGAQKVCLSLLRRVAEQGMRTILISGPDGPLVPAAYRECDEVYLLPALQREVGILSMWQEVVAFGQLMWQLYDLKQKYGSLIVHTHSTKAGVMGRWAAWLVGVQTIVHTVHGFGFHDYQMAGVWWLHYIVEYLTSWVTSEYICVSEKDRHLGARLFPYFKQRCSLIRAAVDWQQFYVPARPVVAELPKAKQKPVVIGTVSCLKPQKNLDDLLEVVRRLVNDDGRAVRLEIVGDGVQRARIEQWIATHDLQEHITLLGWQEQVAPHMRRWDVFALSSLWEGLPCAVVEARLSYLPVVAYQVGGIAEVIKHDKNGLLVRPGDLQGLYRAVRRLVSSKAERQQLGHHAQKLNAFNDVVMGAKHAKLYHNIAQL